MTKGHTRALIVVRSKLLHARHFEPTLHSLFILHLIISTSLLFTNVHAGSGSATTKNAHKGSKTYPVNQKDAWNQSVEACFVSDIDNAEVWLVKHYPGCRDVYGCVVMYEGPQHAMLPGIENITGAYIVANLVNITQINLSTLFKIHQNYDNCRYKYSVMIYGNSNLTTIMFHPTLCEIKGEEVFIKANKNLRIENVTGAPFKVDIGTPEECSLKVAREDEKCHTLVGEVYLNNSMEAEKMWPRIKKLYGTISIMNTKETDLQVFKNLKDIDGWSSPVVFIANNSKLRDISVLVGMNITGPQKPLFHLENNPKLCHTANINRKIEDYAGKKLKWSRECLKKCKGGRVSESFLSNLDPHCSEIEGDIEIKAIEDLPKGIEKLGQIETIKGRLIVKANSALPDLYVLSNLAEINNPDASKPAFEVADNAPFQLKGLKSLKKIHGSTSVTTGKKGDVPPAVKSTLSKISDGGATFAIRTPKPIIHKKHGKGRKGGSLSNSEESTSESNIFTIIGIVVLVLMMIAAVAFIAILVMKKMRENKNPKMDNKTSPISNAPEAKSD
ncbi:hypothetical protein Q1695_003638 [Nippostrongylus brasiliensis]|nr:hypothetical protein Q1695_003638 [Nippostrongylus brasiliensis]